jgi:hypothetical protein
MMLAETYAIITNDAVAPIVMALDRQGRRARYRALAPRVSERPRDNPLRRSRTEPSKRGPGRPPRGRRTATPRPATT